MPLNNLNDIPVVIDFDDSSLAEIYSKNDLDTPKISVYFRGLDDRLITHIKSADVVVGCMAWLTDMRILDALSKVKAAVVVQKEDFLRPDLDAPNDWKSKLRVAYEKIDIGLSRYDVGGLIGALSVAGDPMIQGIRCVGNHNKNKLPAFPRMHNKFLVFCSLEKKVGAINIIPHSVWTGSFNLTKNATFSLENAVVIRDEEIARAYYNEWQHIEALSEPLDWEEDWCNPQWRIGT